MRSYTGEENAWLLDHPDIGVIEMEKQWPFDAEKKKNPRNLMKRRNELQLAIRAERFRQERGSGFAESVTVVEGLERENKELRLSSRKLQRDLTDAKVKTADLVTAVREAAHDAAIIVGAPTVVPLNRDRRVKHEKVMLLHLTDWQTGKISESYNTEVAAARVVLLASKVIQLTQMEQAVHPVKTCCVLLGGDFVEGVQIFPAQAWEVDSSLYAQVFSAAAMIEGLLRSLTQVFERIDVWTEYGNHGRLGRRGDYPARDNMDLMLYRIVEDRTKALPIAWHISPKWHQIAPIGAYRALLVHGDEFKSFGGQTPAFGIARKVNAWASGVIDPFHDVYCVTPDTEALTPDGWRPYWELEGASIATMHPSTSAFEWQVPSRIVTKDYAGALVHHAGRSMDHLSTPDHQMWVKHHAAEEWGKRRSDCTPSGTNWMYRAAPDGWHGTATVPDVPTALEGADVLDIAELLGWYAAEGHASDRQVVIAQSRAKKADKHQRILALFARLGLSPSSQPDYVRVCSKSLADWLRLHSGHLAAGKRFPRWAKAMEAAFLFRMLEAARLGDGSGKHAALDGGVSRYYTSSQQLADDVQEVALKLGMATMVRERQPRGYGSLPSYEIGMAPSPIRRMGERREELRYDGLVWCPTVENGLWLMRRNGRVMITGNCGHFHQLMQVPLARGHGRVFLTPSMESGNTYAEEFVGATGTPAQRLHVIDPLRGRVALERILYLDD